MSDEAVRIDVDYGMVALCDPEDAGLVTRYKWQAWRSGRTYYARTVTEKIHMHKLILPHVKNIDHANGNGLDNRRCNIRAATHSQNAANTTVRRNNKLGIKGVCFHPEGRDD